jgi:hypothetical protein
VIEGGEFSGSTVTISSVILSSEVQQYSSLTDVEGVVTIAMKERKLLRGQLLSLAQVHAVCYPLPIIIIS